MKRCEGGTLLDVVGGKDMAVIAVHLLVVPPVTAGQRSVCAGQETVRD